MNLKIHRQRDESFMSRPVLSPAGKRMITGVFTTIAGIVIMIILISISNKKELRHKQAIADAIDRSITVCHNSLAELKCGAEVQNKAGEYIARIQKEKKLLKKAELAKELITYMLGFSEGNIAVQDELKGAQNRISVALKDYQTKYGAKKI